MKENSNFLKSIDESFKEDYVIDAKSKKTSVLFLLLSFVLLVICFLPFYEYLLSGLLRILVDFGGEYSFIYYLLFFLAMVLYIILHELTHGLFYYIYTHEKLTFGLTLTVAYCGVPNLYVNKKVSLISTLAPFVIFNLLYIPLMIIFFNTNVLLFILTLILFAIHNSGCVGDLYVAILLIFKYKNKVVYVNDTGPKQTFYILNENGSTSM